MLEAKEDIPWVGEGPLARFAFLAACGLHRDIGDWFPQVGVQRCTTQKKALGFLEQALNPVVGSAGGLARGVSGGGTPPPI